MNKKLIRILGLILVLAGLGWFFWLRSAAPATDIHKSATRPASLTPAVSGKVLPSVIDNGPILAPKPGPSAYMALTVVQANAMMEELRKHDPKYILEAMLNAWEVDHDLEKQSAIEGVFAFALRHQNPSPEFWEELRQYVADDTGSRFERELVISSLADAKTQEAVNFLIWAATNLRDKELRATANEEIGTAGNSVGDGQLHEERSSALEQIWQTYSDEGLLKATAVSMAKIGAPSAIELMLSAALAPDGQDDMRKEIANEALTKVYTKNAVPPVAALLRKNWSDTPASELAGTILVRNVDPSAARELMAWLQNADDSAAPLAHDWVESSPNSPLLEDAKAALNPAVGFKSEAVRQAIRDGLAQYNSEHTLGP